MANISLTLYTNSFFGSVLMSPIQMGSLSVNNSVTNISRLGTFKPKTHYSCYCICMKAYFCFLETKPSIFALNNNKMHKL
jgi:hypothetical protein